MARRSQLVVVGAIVVVVALVLVVVAVARGGDGGERVDVAADAASSTTTSSMDAPAVVETSSSVPPTTAARIERAAPTTTAQPPVQTTSTIQADGSGAANGSALPTAHLDSTRSNDDGTFTYRITVADPDGWVADASEWFSPDHWMHKQSWDPADCHPGDGDALPSSTQTFEITNAEQVRSFDVEVHSTGCDGADAQRIRQTLPGAVP